MSQFGQTLFSGSRFIRWALSPFVLLFAILMPVLIDQWTPVGVAIMIGMELMCLALLAGFWLQAPIGHWAFRCVAGLVFLAYTAYLVHELFFTDAPSRVTGRRSEASPFNALMGFVVVGLPSLWFAWRGRLTIRKELTPEQLAAERQMCEEQILKPEWNFYERHLQRPPPRALRELYADRALVTACNLEYKDGIGIGTFNPLHEAELIGSGPGLECDVVAFAFSDCGDIIYLRPGPAERDLVYITYHDGDDTAVLAESVESMLVTLRNANKHVRPMPQ